MENENIPEEDERMQEDTSSDREYEEEPKKRKQNMALSLVIFGILLLLIIGVMVTLKHFMPQYMMSQGKKYLEVGNYEKALQNFENAEKGLPYDNEPVYYKALTLSKMPPSYDTQKALFEISQLEDCDKASELAERSLSEMRNSIDVQIGPNYVDNVLYEDKLIRWNNSGPINYSISSLRELPKEYYDAIHQAFQNWQQAANGEIIFKETPTIQNAQINITFRDNFVKSNSTDFDPEKYGIVIPDFKDSTLNKMDINLKYKNNAGNQFTYDQMVSLAEHEIGHALGLWGHSADPNDVMHFSGDYVNDKTFNKPISERDLNTLLFVYKMIPDVIDRPLSQDQYKNMFYHGAITYYPGKNFEMEVQRLISQLRGDRRNLIIWVDLALNYAYKKQYQRSNFILHKVLPLTSTDFQNQHVILYNLAVNYYKMRDYKTSETYLHYATAYQKDFSTDLLEAFLDYRLQRESLAIEKLLELRKLNQDNIDIALKLAEIYHFQKNTKAEKEAIAYLLKRNPKAKNDRRVKKYRALLKSDFR